MTGMTRATICCLPSDAIAYIGSFLDYPSRIHALATSKVFQSVNYNYPYHSVKLTDNPNFVSHLPFIKRMKPNCNHLNIQCLNATDAIPKL